jgi:hypothetical protein
MGGGRAMDGRWSGDKRAVVGVVGRVMRISLFVEIPQGGFK